jgi:hypothetical protein
MAKLRITFEVDSVELFDRIKDMKGNWSPLVERMAGVLMTGESSFGDAVGMAFYGVTVASAERIDQKAK